MRKFFLLASALVLCNFIDAQNIKQWTELGDEAFLDEEYPTASHCYQKAFELDSTQFNITVKYAEALRLSKNYYLAEYYYYKAFKKDNGRLFKQGQFYLALMQEHNGKHKEALRNYKKFKSKNKKDKEGYLYLKSEQKVESCTWVMKSRGLGSKVKVWNAGEDVNTNDSEFAPQMDKDSTFYYSGLKLDEFVQEGSGVKIYTGNLQDSTITRNGELKQLNVAGFQNGNLTFNPDGTRAYFSRCEGNHCEIYEAEVRSDGSIENEHPIQVINGAEWTSTTPSVGIYNGQEVLFYSSDRPGTNGQMDIWWAFRKDDGSFEAPVNAGDNVNTIENEISPFFLDNKLYFSSEWHIGFGGYDIFISKGYPRSFDLPENIGKPINSSYHDLYYNYSIENQLGFFSSNRPKEDEEKDQTCCHDIYMLQYRDSIIQEEVELEYASLEELNQFLPVTLYFHNDEPDPNTRDTTTTLTYVEAYDDYRKRYSEYIRENTKGLKGDDKENAEYDVEDFFTLFVDKGIQDLDTFIELLREDLEEGKHVDVSIKGFASPRAESDYNVNLTKRRICSLINYLKQTNDSEFLSFIDGTAEKGRLTFNEIPFGEYQADQNVSDALTDEKESIYSRGARLERKIEIQSVQFLEIPEEKKALSIPDWDFGELVTNDPVSKTIEYTNLTNDTLNIVNVEASCGCTVPTIVKTELAPGETTEIVITFNPEFQEGPQEKNVKIFTDQSENPDIFLFKAIVRKP